jgi:hypothetical protein
MQSGFHPSQFLPSNGDLIYIRNGNGGYIGGAKGNEQLKLVPIGKQYEQFIFEMIDSTRFVLKQKESGNYLGGGGGEGESPHLITNRRNF